MFCKRLISSQLKNLKKSMDWQRKLLLALDFDHTIIDDNSDTAINDLAPNKTIPSDICKTYKSNGWTLYMQKVFKYLFENGVSQEMLLSHLNKVPLTSGMKKMFMNIPKDKTEVIIISDSNNIFIEHILANHGLENYIDKVFTNPAKFDKNGCLCITKYHEQNWCDKSSINLCKGQILFDYVESRKLEGIEFGVVAYVGDGMNDLCPGLCLKETDILFPRENHKLHRVIKTMDIDKSSGIESIIHAWSSADDILNRLNSLYGKLFTIAVPSPRLGQPKVQQK